MVFLQACAEALEGDASSRQAVALLRRAEHYHESGDVKRAALDALHFWSLYPEKVKEMGLAWAMLGWLKDAGLYHEAGVLETVADPERSAGAYFAQLSGLPDAPAEAGPLAAYWRNSPDVDAVLAAGALGEEPSVESVEFLARTACLAMHQARPEVAQELFQQYAKHLRGLMAAHGDGAELEPQLLDCTQRAVADVVRLFSNFETMEFTKSDIVYRINTGSRVKLVMEMAGLGVDLAIAVASAEPKLEERAFAATDAQVMVLDILNDRYGVIDAYRRIVEEFPDSREAPDYLAKMAKDYQEAWRDPKQATTVYAEVQTRYPNSAAAAEVRLPYCPMSV